jgi:hypothetical protein
MLDGPARLAAVAGARTLGLGARVAPPAHDLARGLETGYFQRMGYPIGGWLPSQVK